MEETGYMEKGDFPRGSNRIFERLYEYWDVEDGCTYLGSDTARHKTLEPVLGDRLDRGMTIPAKMRVGEVFSSTGDFYERGKFLGEISYTVRLVDRKPVKVVAGYFDKCAHLRTVIQAGDTRQVADEWWVKGVGMVKRVGGEGDFGYYELVAYNLNGDRLVVPGKLVIDCPDAQPNEWLPNYFDIDFGSLPVGGISAEKTVTISNAGDAPLQFSAKLTGSEDFMISNVPTTVTLKSGQSFVVKARYAPKSPEFSYPAAGIEFTYEEDHKTKRQQVSFRGFQPGSALWGK